MTTDIYADLEHAVLRALRNAGTTGATVQEIGFQIGDDAPPKKELRRIIVKMARRGDAVRLAGDVFAAGPFGESLRGTLRWDGSVFSVQSGDHVFEIGDEDVGDAIAGDEVEGTVTAGDARRQYGRVDRVVTPGERRADFTLERVRGLCVGRSDTFEEPVWFPEPPLDRRPGEVVTARIAGRQRFPRGQGAFPRLVLVAQDDEVSDVKAKPDRKAAFAFVAADETHAGRIVDQLATGMDVDRPFPDEALAVAANVPEPEDVAPADGDDLRELPLVTIDGATAKDFDDAVYAEARADGIIRLWVAIADVSHYVPEESALDVEARRRGCSVYLPNRVYPMLPSRLSDDLCSLRPRVPRRCAWIWIDIDRSGAVVDRHMGFGLMKSWARLTYGQVQAHLDAVEADAPIPDSPIVDIEEVDASIQLLDEVRGRLNAKRRARGTLDLDLPEPEIALSEDESRVEHVWPHPRLRAHRLIEECMLAANESVADFLASRGWPPLYRVHEPPNEERLGGLRYVFPNLKLPRTAPDATALTQLIDHLTGKPQGRVFSSFLLRSLPRARYALDDLGHYGIGARRYAHFTSPIRRYPDLEIHRLVRRALAEPRPDAETTAAVVERLEKSAEASNAGEAVSTQAERWCDRLLRALFMQDHVGESFDGVVTDIAPFGLFVQLDDPYVDGLVHIAKVSNEFMEYDEQSRSLTGTRTGRRVRVADVVRVRCTGVKVGDGEIDFELLEGGQVPAGGGRGKRSQGSRNDKKGGAPRGTAKSGTAKSGAAKSGTAKSGTAKSGAAKSGTAKSGAAKSGAAKSGAAKSGAAKSGAAKSGAAKSGTAKSGTAKSDPAKKRGAGNAGAGGKRSRSARKKK